MPSILEEPITHNISKLNTTNLNNIQAHIIHPRQRVSEGHRFRYMDKLTMRVTTITSDGIRSADFCGVFICRNDFDEIICKIGSSSKRFIFDIIKESSVCVEYSDRGI